VHVRLSADEYDPASHKVQTRLVEAVHGVDSHCPAKHWAGEQLEHAELPTVDV